MSISIDKTKLSRIQTVINSIAQNKTLEIEDPDVTFEFIMASCFPSIWDNIQIKMREEYHRGFEEGFIEGKEYNKNLNQN